MKRSEIIILSLFILFYFFWFALPTSFVGSDDYRMVDAFNVDEAGLLQLLKTEIKNRGFNLRDYGYGHLYYNNGLLPLIVRDIFSPVTERQIIIFYRLLSSLYFIGTLLVVFLLAKNYFGKITAWLSVILYLITSTKLYFYSTMLHPDTAQLFFIALSLFFCCKYFEKLKWKHLAFSAFFAGFAFGSKYAGIMLMPLILGAGFCVKYLTPSSSPKEWGVRGREHGTFNPVKLWFAFFICISAVIILNEDWIKSYVALNENSQNFFLLVKAARLFSVLFLCSLVFQNLSQKEIFSFVTEKISDAVLLSTIFLCAFAICSPGSVRGLNFVDGFISNTNIARYGNWFRDELGISGWMKILLSKEVLNYTVFILFAGGFFLNVFSLKKGIANKRFLYFSVLFFWVLIYFSTLVMRINAGFAHYLLPIVPFIIILGSYFLEKLIFLFQKKITLKYSTIVAIAIPLLILGFESFQSAKEIYRFRNDLVNKIENSDNIKAGLFLQENFPPETRILYDRYAYIPLEFNNCFASWGITQRQIMELTPQLIFLNSQIYENYLNKDSAEKYLYGGKEEYLAKHNAYISLLSGNSDYKLLRDFGKMKIYLTSKQWEKTIIFQSENDYESSEEKWSFNNTNLDSLNFFFGTKSEKLIGEYSSSFSAFMSDFFKDSMPQHLYISASVHGLLTDGASAMLVIDFIRNDTERIGNWDVKRFYDVMPDKNNWREINFCRQIPIEVLPTDKVKIYVWNNGEKPIYLDNFSIEVYGLE